MTGGDRLSDSLLANAPATRAMRAAAAATVVVATLFFLILAPFARLRLPEAPAFLPTYEAALAICDLLTGVLLLAQFGRLRSWSLLSLASAYLFSGLMVPPHFLTFPGVFSRTGLLGAGPQTAAWIYLIWHFVFPVLTIGYALLAGDDAPRAQRPGRAVLLAILACCAGALASVAVTTRFETSLPVVLEGHNYARVVALGVSPAIVLLTLIALVAIALRRRGTVLDLWVMVVLWVWLCDATLSAVVGSNRYDLGWYAGRAFGLAGSGFLLGGLLVELNALYGKLSLALVEAQGRNLELERSREDLARAQRLEAVGQLTGGVAHDFNNLLTAIMGALELISRRPTEADRVLRLAASATKAAERGAQLVRQLLSFARRQSLNPEVLDPNAVLTELHTLISRTLGDAIALSFELAPDAPAIRVDAAELQAALLNLANNARDAMPGGGALTLATRPFDLGPDRADVFPELEPGRYLALSAADTGEGMDRATLARAFEPFFTTKPVGKGTGLGLSQVYGFAKSAGGLVAIESEPGAGAIITLYLPAEAGPAGAAAARPEPGAAGAVAGVKVLLVEDDADVLQATREGLVELGFEVVPAADAAEALALLEQDVQVDLLFADIAMPGGISGVELAARARRLRPGLKVLLTSGYSEAALDLAADAPPLLAKPYQHDDLARRLLEILRDT